jgi:integrase
MTIFRTSNSTWTYDFRHLGKRYRERFKSRSEATQAEAKLRLELEKGIGPNKITFREAAQLFLDNHAKPNKASWRHDATKIRRLCQLFGDKKLSEITPLDIQRMRTIVTDKGQSNATADRYHALEKTIFNKMIIWQKFEGFNPAKGVSLKLEPNAHIRFLNKDEATLLENRLRSTDLYPYFVGALHSGMRRGELCNVQWGHVTFALRDIFVPKSKSGKSRHIRMNDLLYSFLKELYGDGKRDDEFVFGTMSSSEVSRRFSMVCKELGIKDFTLHDLRHTFASQLVMKGINIFKVSKWLGHSTVMTTEQYYAHLSRDSQREDIECLNKLVDLCPGMESRTNSGQTLENDAKISYP